MEETLDSCCSLQRPPGGRNTYRHTPRMVKTSAEKKSGRPDLKLDSRASEKVKGRVEVKGQRRVGGSLKAPDR